MQPSPTLAHVACRSAVPYSVTAPYLQSCAIAPSSLTPIWPKWLPLSYPFVAFQNHSSVWFLTFFATAKAPPSTPTNIDAVPQISEAVETFCSSMETGRRVLCSTSMRLTMFRSVPFGLGHYNQYGLPHCGTQARWVLRIRCCNTMSRRALREISRFQDICQLRSV